MFLLGVLLGTYTSVYNYSLLIICFIEILLLSDKICYYLNLLVNWVYLLLFELIGLLVDFEFWGDRNVAYCYYYY